MKPVPALAWVLCGSLLSAALLGAALRADGQNAAAPVTQATTKSRNLKVLPKDISDRELMRLMFTYQQYLGVPCNYCHAQDPDTGQIDYASDDNPVKETARFMITMTGDINSKYLSRLGNSRYAEPITCGNCHRGQVQPPSFDLKPIP